MRSPDPRVAAAIRVLNVGESPASDPRLIIRLIRRICVEHGWFVMGQDGRLQELPSPPERRHWCLRRASRRGESWN